MFLHYSGHSGLFSCMLVAGLVVTGDGVHQQAVTGAGFTRSLTAAGYSQLAPVDSA